MKLSDLSDLFDQAIGIGDGAARDAFVEEACPDEDSRNQLNKLISAHYQTHSMVDEPEAAVRIARDLGDSSASESPVREGERLGNYKLLQRIGEGGMGYVFMAEQVAPIQRRVAIKVIKTSNSSRQVLNRFEAERSALARLDHPNITRIIDAGATDSGAPYFVMELVRGDSLTEYCDRHKLSINERVALVERVCLAVHHAHQKAILHRDIKPSNIMVTLHDGEPIPKIIDFGIAKALDRPLVEGTMFTRYGDMVGTPQYMSPEQAEKSGLDLDVRTDIYSLGAVLFELLTGTPPIEQSSLEGKGVLGVLEAVRDNDTESPSTRATRIMAMDDTIASTRSTDHKHLPRLLRGELDWIVLKSLARARSQRYESAAAMARDLRAYLEGGTIDAAAPSFLYQSRKLFQRHRTVGLGIVATAAMMLVMTLVSLAWAFSNNELRKIATDRASELSEINDQLERQEAVLRATIERAQAAEQQAMILVNEKKEQAALEKAIRRHFESMFSYDQMVRVVGDSTTILQGAKIIDVSEDMNQVFEKLQPSEITVPMNPTETNLAMSANATSAGVMSSQVDVKKIEIHVDGSIVPLEMSPVSRGLESLSPQIHNMLMLNSDSFGGIIVEEFRSEFGENHQKVAEVLVHIARIGLANPKAKSDVLESRLREAIAIVGKDSQPQAVATMIAARALLAELLTREERLREASRQLQNARSEYESATTMFSQKQRSFLDQELERVSELVAAE